MTLLTTRAIMVCMDLSKYTGIHYDSRKVEPGYIFVAIKGEKFDANKAIPEVIEKGATLIVSEMDHSKSPYIKDGVEFQQVASAREALAYLSHDFYGKPSEQVSVFGVTGTNGKTTVTHLAQAILDDCALLGTMGLKEKLNDEYKDLGNTTPQSKDTHAILRNLVKQDFKYLAMEVSSHALEQFRVGSIKFKTSVVTNLTQDHLDYHLTMDNYFQAKAKIFQQTKDFAVLNIDDEYFEQFQAKALENNLKIISFGIKDTAASLLAKDIEYHDHGLSYTIVNNTNFDTDNNEIRMELKLNGSFNVYNSLAAIAIALIEGLSLKTIQERLQASAVVSGRFEMLKSDAMPYCIVDYAHSPDGLLNVLKGTKNLFKNDSAKIYCVFGCGGDRDITKRPKMGKIAFEHADYCFVTSDNPRTEDPEQILADILAGIPDLSKVKVIEDRRQAIQDAIKTATENDYVVIAGKGHENYQILKDKTIHFDDKEEVENCFKLLKQ